MDKEMKNMNKNVIQLTLENLEVIPLTYGSIILNKERFLQVLDEINALQDLDSIKK